MIWFKNMLFLEKEIGKWKNSGDYIKKLLVMVHFEGRRNLYSVSITVGLVTFVCNCFAINTGFCTGKIASLSGVLIV